MIKPTVGRVVWFRMATDSPHAQPMRADICYVHNDSMINIAFNDWNGNPGAQTSVLLWDGQGERPTGQDYCEWMPYQIGQAKKTEEIAAGATTALSPSTSAV